MPHDADMEAYLKLFEDAWRPLDPQVRLVLRVPIVN
jgi:hypothetical protein